VSGRVGRPAKQQATSLNWPYKSRRCVPGARRNRLHRPWTTSRGRCYLLDGLTTDQSGPASSCARLLRFSPRVKRHKRPSTHEFHQRRIARPKLTGSEATSRSVTSVAAAAAGGSSRALLCLHGSSSRTNIEMGLMPNETLARRVKNLQLHYHWMERRLTCRLVDRSALGWPTQGDERGTLPAGSDLVPAADTYN
jgi:hypothetical protein